VGLIFKLTCNGPVVFWITVPFLHPQLFYNTSVEEDEAFLHCWVIFDINNRKLEENRATVTMCSDNLS
jgi:hypothetical protein